uniref:uncharacterized protein LOC120813009 n=1 Tax=Gasterosteus aculeatus aculeatus TaxID=481459 RepID=UPI001A982F1A|nr:uncharacterized protein LOC120813009 [Gasterosteus aculeatus aculeatus]
MVQDHPSDWDKYIQPTVFGLRTKKQLTTKYSPYFLLYGREARYPSEIPDKWQISEERVHIYMTNEDVCTHTNDLKEVYNKVEANIAETQEKVRKRKLAKGDDDSFAVGDKVLRKNIWEEQRKGGKLETDLLGPYMAIHIDGKSADLTTLQGKNVCKVNIDHLKRYVEPEVRIPAKWIAATSTSPPALQPSPVRCLGVPQSPPVAPKSDSLTSSLSSWPAPASPEELIADIWAGQRQGVLWSKVGPYKIFATDLQNLAPGRQLESEQQKETESQFFLIDSFQMTAMWQGSFRGLRKLDPVAFDILIGPVFDKQHWTLVVMYPKKKRVLYLDPLGETPEHLNK